MLRIEVNGASVFILPVIKGLVSEAQKVREAVQELNPQAIGVSISREDLDGLRTYDGSIEYELNDLEDAYRLGLENFGEVQIPPPCYTEALRIANDRGLPIIPLDMNEEQFSDRYCELIGGFELMKESFFAHRALKKNYNLESAEAFVLDYEVRVNGGKGIRLLNQEREEHMAEAIRGVSTGRSTVLCIVELERALGVAEQLTEK